MSFIAGANGVGEVGQYAAQSCHDLRPIAWMPAAAIVATVQALPSSSRERDIQSVSPFNPAMKPSIDIDIFKISFLIVSPLCNAMHCIAMNEVAPIALRG
jgi:hypothetical protein